MIPAEIAHGRKLTNQEREDFFAKFKNDEEYTKLLNEVQSFNSFGQEKVFRAGNVAEFLLEGNLLVTTVLIVQFGESLFYFQETKEKNEVRTALIAGTVAYAEDTKLFLNFFTVGDTVEIISNLYVDQLEKDYEEELPNDQSYTEGISNDQMSIQAWYDGCYPGYRHCGANCGDNGKTGGGTVKNAYDNCCRAHDRCWANFGTNNCNCDCTFLKCAKANWTVAPLALHTLVLGAFPRKSSCKC